MTYAIRHNMTHPTLPEMFWGGNSATDGPWTLEWREVQVYPTREKAEYEIDRLQIQNAHAVGFTVSTDGSITVTEL